MKKLPWLVALLVLAGCAPTTPGGTTSAPAPVVTTTIAPIVPDAKKCTVPNVVGMVHQTAQDTMQAAGLYYLAEEDATGKGRLLVVDRNWETTAQSVAAGEVVACSTKITLSAKKIGE